MMSPTDPLRGVTVLLHAQYSVPRHQTEMIFGYLTQYCPATYAISEKIYEMSTFHCALQHFCRHAAKDKFHLISIPSLVSVEHFSISIQICFECSSVLLK